MEQDNFVKANNKLGIFDESIIDKIVQYKMSVLNSKFTFNEQERGLDYLKKIHAFLFGDIYDDAGVFSKRIDDNVIAEANNLIKYINSLFEYVNYDETIEEIKVKMNDLINLQLFDDGNKRSISTYCRIILEEYRENKNMGSR